VLPALLNSVEASSRRPAPASWCRLLLFAPRQLHGKRKIIRGGGPQAARLPQRVKPGSRQPFRSPRNLDLSYSSQDALLEALCLPQILSALVVGTIRPANQMLDPRFARTMEEHPHEKSTLRLAIKGATSFYRSKNRQSFRWIGSSLIYYVQAARRSYRW
jgi:hypothetical protein